VAVSSVAFQIAPCPPEASERLAAALGVSRVTADTLVRRGLDDPAAARRFLDLHGPQHDPLLLGDAEEACDLLEAAIGAGTSVVVHGDYDADGVCATAVLTGVLRDLGAVVRPFLPEPLRRGLRPRGRHRRAASRGRLRPARHRRLRHHGRRGRRARRRARPRRDRDRPPSSRRGAARLPARRPRGHGAYPFPDLCGAGVAWKLGQALVARLDADPGLLDRYLDLVALATVADLVPLVGENRGLVRAGLTELRRGRRPGPRGADARRGRRPRPRGSTQIGFGLAPRLNAAGRMGTPTRPSSCSRRTTRRGPGSSPNASTG
jgi:single-stranded-DNA-specific exonuclease